MEALIGEIERLKGSDVSKVINERIEEFKRKGESGEDEIFSEMCFCITTANFNAKRSMEMQEKLRKDYCYLPEPELAGKLREMGHRFPEARAGYISGARTHKEGIKDKMSGFEDETELRGWIADNVKGLGYKEASHFLRNIGHEDVAIIDFHIIDLLVKHKIIERPKTLTKKRYLEIEGKLRELAGKVNLNLAELDLYLWHMETGKILK